MSTGARLSELRSRWRFPTSWQARIGLAGIVIIFAIAFFGPFVSPHSPSEIVGTPFRGLSWEAPLGTDHLGRDVLSRVLWGGRSLIGLAVAATAAAYVLGVPIGLVAGYSRSYADPLLMRAMDVLLAFPPLLFLLVLVTGAGPGSIALIVGAMLVNLPGIARLVRAATLEVSVRGYVEAAVARGERMHSVLRREVVPNITGPLFADVGVRLTLSILLIAAVTFLGLGPPPPAANWALMINENRAGISIQPWVIVVPSVLIAILTIAVNLVADAIARSRGISLVEPQ